MLSLSAATRVFVALEPVDMRNYAEYPIMQSGDTLCQRKCKPASKLRQ